MHVTMMRKCLNVMMGKILSVMMMIVIPFKETPVYLIKCLDVSFEPWRLELICIFL